LKRRRFVKDWSDLKKLYGHCCARCGRRLDRRGVRSTRDHIVPRSQGGSDRMKNMQPLCRECNQWKADRTIYYPPVERRRILVKM
jgi:5-methylcytosine-specific restriction endonuclease McrA